MTQALEDLISACKNALNSGKPQQKITEIVTNAIADQEALKKMVGWNNRAGVEKLYVSDEITIINFIWAPKMALPAHNHSMWAVIGVYSGREDNIFWRRKKNDPNGKLEAAGAKTIEAGEAVSLGKEMIHSVVNPTDTFTRALHVYGGNFFEIERSEWDPLTLNERPYDIDQILSIFESENAIIDALGIKS
jgi:predicted metal-dependent enzyme (double-stranded beta helix superfamily)